MRKAFIAAITATTLATAAAAEDTQLQQDEVFECLTDRLDQEIEKLQDFAQNFADTFANALGVTTETSVEAVYTEADKMDWVEECKGVTGSDNSWKAEGIRTYGHSGVKITFE